LIAAALVEIPQASSDLGRLTQWFVKILEVENGDALMGRYEIQGSARSVRATLIFRAV
jgi:hypothetical protein